MEFSTCKFLIPALILALFTDSALSVTCCDFSPSYGCDWNWVATSWVLSSSGRPDITDPIYSNFYGPLNDGSFAWLQDQSGTMSSVDQFVISSTSSVISFNYYYNTVAPLEDQYLHVIFHPSSGQPINGVVVASITVPANAWASVYVTCDSSNDYCCGSYSAVPCTGYIEVTASLDVTVNSGLFAIDNLCSDGYVTTPPPPPPTTTLSPLPPPHPSPNGCCEFNTDVCDFYVVVPSWYWSPYSYAPSVPVSWDGTYSFLWAENSGSTIANSLTPYLSYTTFFSLSYYISSPSVSLQVYFVQTGYPSRLINSLTYTGNVWSSYSTQPLVWCGSSCSGTFEIVLTGYGVAAIDDTDFNGACGGNLPCCNFDDPHFCHLTPSNPSIPWEWSGSSTPRYPVPPPSPNSQFVYFETPAGYLGPAINSALVSEPIAISESTFFRANLYVYTPFGEGGLDSLQLNFREDLTGITTGMDFAKTTSDRWYVLTFYCNSVHGDCCQGAATCTGVLEINAHVESTDGGQVFYGIDALEINDLCPTFPSLTMFSGPEKKVIPLKPKRMH